MDVALEFDPSVYGSAIAELLAVERVPPLGPGTENAAARAQLEAATVERLFGGSRVANPSMAQACISGLWLYHDFLDRSHTISQSIANTTGSYWHGIMHRREPDFDNSRYWFRRVGPHAIFPHLAKAARSLAGQATGLKHAAGLQQALAWDPFAFIDLCETCYRNQGPDHDLCRRVSLAEWRLLFDHSYREATGAKLPS